MTKGYIYCISNSSMPGIFKVGVTNRTIEARLQEANKPDTWKPPTKYVVEFLAELKGVTSEELANKTTDNFFRLFTKAIKNS